VIVLHILLWIVLVLLALALVLLLVPTHVSAAGQLSGLSGRGHLLVRWGWVVVMARADSHEGVIVRLMGIPLFRRSWQQLLVMAGSWTRASSGGKEAKGRVARPAGRPKSKGDEQEAPFTVARLRLLWSLVFRVLRTLRIRGWIQGAVGLDDPSDTAWLASALYSLSRPYGKVEVNIEPCWLEERVELQGELSMRLWPIHTLVVVLWILLERSSRQALGISKYNSEVRR